MGILQARILESVAMPSPKGSSQPRAQTLVSCSSCTAGRFFITEAPGKKDATGERPRASLQGNILEVVEHDIDYSKGRGLLKEAS